MQVPQSAGEGGCEYHEQSQVPHGPWQQYSCWGNWQLPVVELVPWHPVVPLDPEPAVPEVAPEEPGPPLEPAVPAEPAPEPLLELVEPLEPELLELSKLPWMQRHSRPAGSSKQAR